MKSEIDSWLLAIAIFQYAFLGTFLLFSRAGNRLSNVLLGLFSLCMGLNLLDLMLSMSGQFELVAFLSLFDLVTMTLFGPLMFLYVQSLLDNGFKLIYKHVYHFIPGLLVSLYVAISYFSIPHSTQIELTKAIHTSSLSSYQLLLVIPFYVHILIYAIWTFIKYKSYTISAANKSSTGFRWLQFLFIGLAMMFVISTALSFLPHYPPLRPFAQFFLIIFITITFFLINMILIKGLQQPGIFSTMPSVRYQSSNLSESAKTLILKSVEQVMLDKHLYLNPQLSLNMLAREIDSKPRHVSQVINEYLGVTFHDYVNEMRVQYAIDTMEHAPTNTTILEILFDSGFNSKSSFNMAFKKVTSQTPTEYRKSVLKNS